MQNSRKNLSHFHIICLVGFAAFFSSYLRIPVMPLFAATMGAGPAEVGTINGAFMLTAGLLSIPGGLLADRIGRKPPIAAGIVAIAGSSLLVTICSQPGQMVAAYVLFGIGLASFATGMLSLVADVIPAERLGQAYGWYTTSTYVAMTLGPATGGYLAKVMGLRQVFTISGGLLLAVAIVACGLLPKGPPRRRSDLHSVIAGSFQLLRNSSLIACLAATVGSCIGFGFFLTFIPLYASLHGCDPAQVGLIFAAQALTNVIGRVPIGRLADRVDRRLIAACGLICLTVALSVMGEFTGLFPLLGCAVLLGVGMALTFTTIGAMIADSAPPLQRGLAMGLYNSCIYLGMMSGATGMGHLLKQVGYPVGFVVAGGVNLVGLAIFLIMARGKGSLDCS
jgi:MFS family permease